MIKIKNFKLTSKYNHFSSFFIKKNQLKLRYGLKLEILPAPRAVTLESVNDFIYVVIGV